MFRWGFLSEISTQKSTMEPLLTSFSLPKSLRKTHFIRPNSRPLVTMKCDATLPKVGQLCGVFFFFFGKYFSNNFQSDFYKRRFAWEIVTEHLLNYDQLFTSNRSKCVQMTPIWELRKRVKQSYQVVSKKSNHELCSSHSLILITRGTG